MISNSVSIPIFQDVSAIGLLQFFISPLNYMADITFFNHLKDVNHVVVSRTELKKTNGRNILKNWFIDTII